ncbi:MAG: hypothetical protein NVS9B4_00530 [Candidatus Acidiferrum sp.]
MRILLLFVAVSVFGMDCYHPKTVDYFGFFASEYAPTWDDGAASLDVGTNVVHVGANDVNTYIRLIQQAHARGQKTILSLYFIYDLNQPNGLRADWQARMDALFLGGTDPATGAFTPGLFYAESNYATFAQNVVAFYSLDEPYYQAKRAGISAQTILDSMNAVHHRLHTNYGNGPRETPIAQIFSTGELSVDETMPGYFPDAWRNVWNQHSLKLPDYTTWVGFDCYNGWSCPSGGATLPANAWTTTSNLGRDSWYRRIKLLSNSFYPNGNMRTIVVPPSFVGADGPSSEGDLQYWVPWYGYTPQDDDAVVAILPWLWGRYTFPDGGRQFGLGDLSQASKQVFRDFKNCSVR